MEKLFYYLKKEIILTSDSYLFFFVLKLVAAITFLMLPLFLSDTTLEIAGGLLQTVLILFVVITPISIVQKSNSVDKKNIKDIKILPSSKIAYFLTKFFYVTSIFILDIFILKVILPNSIDRILFFSLINLIPILAFMVILFLKKYISHEFKYNLLVITITTYLSFYFLYFIVFFYSVSDSNNIFDNYSLIIYSLIFSSLVVSLWSYYFDKRCEL